MTDVSETLPSSLNYPFGRYLMFYWPISSSFMGILFNFIILSIISFLSWDQMLSYIFKEPRKDSTPEKDWTDTEEYDDRVDFEPFVMPEREERILQKKDERKDVMKDLRSSMTSQRSWASSGRMEISYSDSDDDILLFNDHLDTTSSRSDPRKTSESNIKSGSSDSFETIEDSREDLVTMETGNPSKQSGLPGARFRGTKVSED